VFLLRVVAQHPYSNSRHRLRRRTGPLTACPLVSMEHALEHRWLLEAHGRAPAAVGGAALALG